MSQLEALNFEIIKSYEHDDWVTQRRQKGCITIETTWLKTGEFVSQDLMIEHAEISNFGKFNLEILDKILNKTK
jgi:hypothetical protein